MWPFSRKKANLTKKLANAKEISIKIDVSDDVKAYYETVETCSGTIISGLHLLRVEGPGFTIRRVTCGDVMAAPTEDYNPEDYRKIREVIDCISGKEEELQRKIRASGGNGIFIKHGLIKFGIITDLPKYAYHVTYNSEYGEIILAIDLNYKPYEVKNENLCS